MHGGRATSKAQGCLADLWRVNLQHGLYQWELVWDPSQNQTQVCTFLLFFLFVCDFQRGEAFPMMNWLGVDLQPSASRVAAAMAHRSGLQVGEILTLERQTSKPQWYTRCTIEARLNLEC